MTHATIFFPIDLCKLWEWLYEGLYNTPKNQLVMTTVGHRVHAARTYTHFNHIWMLTGIVVALNFHVKIYLLLHKIDLFFTMSS